MNGRRFGKAFTPSSSSSFSSFYRGKSSPLLPRYSFFRASTCTYARITSGMSLASGRENDVTALSGWPKRRDVARARSLVLPSCNHVVVATVELIYEILANFCLKKQKKIRKQFLPFFFLFLGNFGFIGSPEIFNALTWDTGIYSSLSHFVVRRGH